ncbi:MAG: hypothetical protein PHN98_11115, partial [Smithellaceae bacterium]|nr:hypothetical protein [Smithellaceae bacterium]
MKKYLSKVIPAFIIILMFLFAPAGVITDLNADQNNDPGVGYLENILFEKLSGRERVSLVVSQQPKVAPPSIQSDGNLLIRLDDLFAPEHLRNSIGEGRLLNVTSVSAQQQTEAGRQWVNLRIRLKENVPYTIRQEGKIIVIDFNISGVEAKLKKASRLVDRSQRSSSLAETEMDRFDRRDGAKKYTGKNISLDFQDADIKSVLRLMSEYGDKSIIAGDD